MRICVPEAAERLFAETAAQPFFCQLLSCSMFCILVLSAYFVNVNAEKTALISVGRPDCKKASSSARQSLFLGKENATLVGNSVADYGFFNNKHGTSVSAEKSVFLSKNCFIRLR